MTDDSQRMTIQYWHQLTFSDLEHQITLFVKSIWQTVWLIKIAQEWTKKNVKYNRNTKIHWKRKNC